VKTLALNLFARFAFCVLRLRYRVEFRGEENLKGLKKHEGILFLPSHPSEIESLFLALKFWPKFRFRAIAVEYAFHVPFVGAILRWMKAIPVAKLIHSVNEIKAKTAEAALEAASLTLKSRGAVLLYPAGRIKSGSLEIVGGVSGAQLLVQRFSTVNVVLIRIRGLWGSSFSQALTGESPDPFEVLLHGLKALFKNGLFFLPRRKVTIEIEVNPPNFPRNSSRAEFNRYLEQWINLKPDSLQIVPYQFWSQKKPLPYLHKKKAISGGNPISEETQEKINAEIRKIMEDPQLKLSPSMSLVHDLGMDSLNMADLIAFLMKNFDTQGFKPEDLMTFREITLQEIFMLAEGAALTVGAPKLSFSFIFPEEQKRPSPVLPEGATLPEVFLKTAARMGSFSACIDPIAGLMSYAKMKRSVLILASHFATFPEERIAVMLPASTAAFITALAISSAGKVPVMLNWTLGPRYLEQMMEISGAQKVLTSWSFIDRLSHVDFGKAADKLLYLEKIRTQLTWKAKLKGLFFTPPKIDPNAHAVILFTSGSDRGPKCVPLTHTNLLSNMSTTYEFLKPLYASDVNFSILPPFHSLGFNCAGLFPLLIGTPSSFYPDPTDSASIAEGIAQSQATIFAAPPSFLKRLFAAASSTQLKTIRHCLSGAEKTPNEVIEQAKERGVELVEAYGVTECSPAVSSNYRDRAKKGVGFLGKGFHLITIHPETHALLPPHTEGEICLRGPSVFNGYLGAPSPFIEINNQKWYRTGDLGKLDEEGYLILSGRLKRFIKIGGEMISLGAIETILSEKFSSIAISSKESSIVLFSVNPITKENVNETLKQSGFSNLIKVSKIIQVGEIPLMGTGKIDYHKLSQLI
jgi:long-chain-fatty-acid--[acyl-carrier-protein] ligase